MRSKFGAIRTDVDGVSFASRKEARRYAELKLLVKAGEITDLVLQPRFPIVVGGVKVCTYVADFSYKDTRSGGRIVEDVKGVKTPVFRIKAKLMLAVHGIEVIET